MVWGLFNLLIIGLLVLDLGVFHKKDTVISIKQALLWSAVWITFALFFDLGLYAMRGREPALNYLTCFLLEKSLSVDNIFVFLIIFTYFKVPARYQHRVLYFGIFGAIILRAIFIFAGTALMSRIHWIIYLFGAFLIYTGLQLCFEKNKEIEPEKNPILKLFRRFVPMTEKYEEGKFFVMKSGRLFATPLFIALLVVEASDIVFATDSVPAAFGITLDPFIIYTSNIFAILGLRALYFAVAGLMRAFHYLHYGLSFILVFVGIKMLIDKFVKIPVIVTLSVVVVTLLISAVASIRIPKNVSQP
jgi:tellurite resistance protein TerC